MADELFVQASAQVLQQPNTNLDQNVNLKRKRHCKLWRFSLPETIVSHFCSLEPLLQITGGMKKNYVISGQEWSGRELSREPFIRAVVFYVSRSYINSSFHVLYKPRQE